MNKAILILLSILAAVLSASGQSEKAPAGPATKNATVEQLKQLDVELGDAFLRGDGKALEGMLADGMVIFNGDGNVVATKGDILAQMNSQPGGPPGPKPTVTVDKVDVFVYGSTAIVSSKLTFKMEMNGKVDSSPSSQVDTYTLDKGRWRLILSQMSEPPPNPQPYTASDVRFDISIDPALIKGSKDANVVLIEFVDYQCPLCRKFAAETADRLQADYVTPGKVALIARDLPLETLHPLALGAAKAAYCSREQGKLWEMHERLLRGALTPADLSEHAKALNLDLDKFAKCVGDEKTAAAILREKGEADKMGITGTPYFLIGVRKPGSTEVKAIRLIKGAFPYEVYKAALDSVITAREQ
jgi:protein-disulfide isomerase